MKQRLLIHDSSCYNGSSKNRSNGTRVYSKRTHLWILILLTQDPTQTKVVNWNFLKKNLEFIKIFILTYQEFMLICLYKSGFIEKGSDAVS